MSDFFQKGIPVKDGRADMSEEEPTSMNTFGFFQFTGAPVSPSSIRFGIRANE